MLIRINTDYYVAGLTSEYRQGDGDIVMTAAPIIKYMIGWQLTEVAKYCNEKNWALEIVDPDRERK